MYKITLSKQDITQLEINAVVKVLQSPKLALGPKLKEFENLVAFFVGVKYAVAVNSGTSALHLIIKALGINKGDEVITTPFSFVASSSPLLIPKAFIIKCNALVPEFTATAYFTPTKNATKFSNSFSLGPNANFGLCNTLQLH